MDTYSELTDRSYKFRDQHFCCHRSDFLSSPKASLFGPGDLIGVKELADGYRDFFRKLRVVNKEITIIIILFPVKFETRSRYRMQYSRIKMAINSLDLSGVRVIDLDESMVHKDPEDDFPYHLSELTSNHLRVTIDSIIKFQ
jgi:hypothetical protein